MKHNETMESQRESLKRLIKLHCRDEKEYMYNPIEFIEDTFAKIVWSFGSQMKSTQIISIVKWNYNAVKDKYLFWGSFYDNFIAWKEENTLYGKTLRKGFFTMLWDDHACLTSAWQCDKCGAITHMDDSCDGLDRRIFCPVCNEVEDNFPIHTYTSKVKDKINWVNKMLWARAVEDPDNDFYGGDYSKCNFKPTNYEYLLFTLKSRINIKIDKFKRYFVKEKK